MCSSDLPAILFDGIVNPQKLAGKRLPDDLRICTQNSRLADGIESWRAPLIASGELLPMTATLFFSQNIGPAQIFCRAWLSGRDRTDPTHQADALIACAIRALVAPQVVQKTGGMA